MDYHPGGDLLSVLERREQGMGEEEACFYLAEISKCKPGTDLTEPMEEFSKHQFLNINIPECQTMCWLDASIQASSFL